jgi:hypothetical protein
VPVESILEVELEESIDTGHRHCWLLAAAGAGAEQREPAVPVAREALCRFFEAHNLEDVENVDAMYCILRYHKSQGGTGKSGKPARWAQE